MMIIRAKTMRAWMKANLSGYMRDIASHGCIGGFPGLTYYTDTVKLYDRFEEEIWEALRDDAEDIGYSNILKMLAEFNATVDDPKTFKNLLVWYIAERIAREATNG